MRIKMTVDMSGTRCGVPWPPRGTVMDLPDDEARQYCAAGMAVPAADKDADVETATPPDDEEARTALTTQTGPAKRTRR